MRKRKYICWLEDLSSRDLPIAGGKNAALGDMIQKLKSEGISVPNGFTTTAEAYWELLKANDMGPKMSSLLNQLKSGKISLENVGSFIRRLFLHARFPERLSEEIYDAYQELCLSHNKENLDVAVRSSATAEDLPEASFAGMLDSFLNISGQDQLMDACRRCYASLFTDRAIGYREKMGFDHMKVALSIGIQQMVRSDQAGAGVMFSIDRKSGFPDLVLISAAWGLGENVVQGMVIPDEYKVSKPLLRKMIYTPIVTKFLGDKEKRRVYVTSGQGGTIDVETSEQERTSFVLKDDEILKLAGWACVIEAQYGKAMDIEWAKDGTTGRLYIVQARPLTAQAPSSRYSMTIRRPKEKRKPLLRGLSIGDRIATGEVCLIESSKKVEHIIESCIVVSESANTTWVAAMREKQIKGLVTDFGGRSSHSAIISRELGIPGILGTLKATKVLKSGQRITISPVDGDYGYVYNGVLEYEEKEINFRDVPRTRMRIMMNVSSEAAALQWWPLSCDGIGLVRMHAILEHIIEIHPLALVHFDRLKDEKDRHEIQILTRGYEDKPAYFVNRLSSCIAEIAASRYPDPVIVRMSALKTHEYASLKCGRQFEPLKTDIAFGLRGASRYLSDHYREAFALECRAVKRAREEIGFTNIHIMIPYCQSPAEADKVLKTLAENGLKRGENGLQIHLSCDLISNVGDAVALAERFDGFSVAARKLRRLTPGKEVESTRNFRPDEKVNISVRGVLKRLIEAAHGAGYGVTIRGRTFSRSQKLITLLVEAGIDALSLNPEGIPQVKHWVAAAEAGFSDSNSNE